MNTEVISTCALTGSGDSALKSDTVPVTLEQVATEAVKAAKAGAAAVHVHMRNPETRQFSWGIELYKETTCPLRGCGVDTGINLINARAISPYNY